MRVDNNEFNYIWGNPQRGQHCGTSPSSYYLFQWYPSVIQPCRPSNPPFTSFRWKVGWWQVLQCNWGCYPSFKIVCHSGGWGVTCEDKSKDIQGKVYCFHITHRAMDSHFNWFHSGEKCWHIRFKMQKWHFHNFKLKVNSGMHWLT